MEGASQVALTAAPGSCLRLPPPSGSRRQDGGATTFRKPSTNSANGPSIPAAGAESHPGPAPASSPLSPLAGGPSDPPRSSTNLRLPFRHAPFHRRDHRRPDQDAVLTRLQGRHRSFLNPITLLQPRRNHNR